MLKLLIVDDEKFTRDCMASILPWSTYNIEIIGTAGDGLEALQCLEKNQTDIVITDIKMPQMDGLQLLQQIRQRWPQIEVVILSGFEEFEYAKKAMNLGARNYILKPIDPSELLKAIVEASERITSLQASDSENDTATFLNNLIYSCYTDEEYREVLQKHSDIINKWFVLFNIQLDNLSVLFSRRPISAYSILMTQITRICDSDDEMFYLDKNPQMMSVAICKDSCQSTKNKADIFVNDLCGLFSEADYPFYAIGMSQPYEGINKIGDAYLETRRFVNLKYMFGNEHIFCSDQEFFLEKFTYTDYDAVIARIIHFTVNYSEDEVDSVVKAQFDEFKKQKTVLLNIQRFTRITIGRLLNENILSNIPMSELYANPVAYLSMLSTSDDVRELQRRLLSFLHTVGRFLVKHRAGNSQQIAEQVKSYIQKNFQSSKLSLKEISEVVNFSPAYLSSVFKNECGYGISTYINQTRIESACAKLVETDKKIITISEESGFLRLAYFGTVFRKFTGMTPSEYREKGSQEEKNE